MKELAKIARLGGAHAENLFQKARLKAGVSQEQAAEHLSCATRTLQRYEAGETAPDYPTLRGMMECYRCEAADLFAAAPIPNNESGGDAQ